MDKVVHFEIPVDDLERAKSFYGSIFGWKLDDFPGMGYTGITTVPTGEDHMPTQPGAINGGMMQRTDKVAAPVVAINVDSVDACVEKVQAGGGAVVTPKVEIAGMGYYAYVNDSEGNVIGLWQNL